MYPSDTPECSRLVVLLHDMEVRDRLVQSRINKFLYQYSTDTMPRQTHANMVSISSLYYIHVHLTYIHIIAGYWHVCQLSC